MSILNDNDRIRICFNTLQTENKLKQKVVNVLMEAWRRIKYHKNEWDEKCNVLLFPSQAKEAKEAGLITISFGIETPRILHWYKLTPKGIELLKPIDVPMSEELNDYLFNRKFIWTF